MDATLYSIPISHPARAAGLMLEHKGIRAKRVDIPAGSQQVVLRLNGFRGGTVPAMNLDGRRIQGTREISRALDEVQPDPPLFPRDPAQRAAVEEAERWGDEVYQPVPRRIFRWAAASRSDVREALANLARMPAPKVTSYALLPVTQFYMRLEGGGEDAARRDAQSVPEHIDRVDSLVAEGVIDGDALNAADFQIGVTTRVLLNFREFRPFIEGRPAERHAMRLLPDFGRELPVELPREWIPTP